MYSKLILILLVSFGFISCGKKLKENQSEQAPVFKSDTTHFDFKLDVFDAVIYKDKLILLEYSSADTNMHFRRRAKYIENSKSRLIDLLTNKEDTLFHVPEKVIDIKVTRDSLWAKNANEDWFVLENDKWVKREIYPNKHHQKFTKSNYYKYCNVIIEDTTYLVYSFDMGEFGNGIIYLNKLNGNLTGVPIHVPKEISKINGIYYLRNEFEAHGTVFDYTINLIKNPDLLFKYSNNKIKLNYDLSSVTDPKENSNLSEITFFEIYLKSINHLAIAEYFEVSEDDIKDGYFDRLEEWNNKYQMTPNPSLDDNLYNVFYSGIDQMNYKEIYPGPTFKHKKQVHHVFYDYTDSISQIYTQTSLNGLLDTTQKHFDIVDVSNKLNEVHFKDKSIVGLTNNTIVIVSNDHIKRYTFKK